MLFVRVLSPVWCDLWRHSCTRTYLMTMSRPVAFRLFGLTEIAQRAINIKEGDLPISSKTAGDQFNHHQPLPIPLSLLHLLFTPSTLHPPVWAHFTPLAARLTVLPILRTITLPPVTSTVCFTADQVRRWLMKLNWNKAPGPDGVSPRVLIACASQLCGVLHYVFSMSLSLQRVPMQWKTSCVIAVPKTNSCVTEVLQHLLNYAQNILWVCGGQCCPLYDVACWGNRLRTVSHTHFKMRWSDIGEL